MNAAVWTTPRCWKSRNSRYVPGVGNAVAKSIARSGLALLGVDVEVAQVAGADRDEVAEGAEVGLEVGHRLAVELDARGEHGARARRGVALEGDGVGALGVSTVAVRSSAGSGRGREVAGHGDVVGEGDARPSPRA